MEVYEEYAYCFSCGHRESLDGLDIKPPQRKPPTDISKMIKYILTLPLTKQRGLYFCTDDTGYYIIWPDNAYYKKRMFEGSVRYIGPRGHKAPLLIYPSPYNKLVIVEGEINALTLVLHANISDTICSPGSATEMLRHLDYYLTFDQITIIVDKDIPGVVNGLKLKDELIKRGKRVLLHATEKDCNEIYQKEGREGLQAWFEKNMVMS